MQGEFQILAPLWRRQLSNCFTTGCKRSKPSSLWLLSWWALFLLRRDERRENPLQEGTRWSHSTPPPLEITGTVHAKEPVSLAGLLGQVAWEQGSLPTSPRQPERSTPQPQD